MWWARWIYSVPPASYDGRIYFNLDKLHRPTNETEIVSLVQKAYKDGGKIRVIGDGHSWSEIAQTQDIMISLVDYTGLVGVDRDKMTATFKAGTSLSDISQVLEKEGLAMINLGSVAGQSIAGAISTGTHGTGITVGNLASLVVGLRIVSGDDGKVYTHSHCSCNHIILEGVFWIMHSFPYQSYMQTHFF
jgi:FAD/FMN-containing dehydrogenase